MMDAQRGKSKTPVPQSMDRVSLEYTQYRWYLYNSKYGDLAFIQLWIPRF